MDEEWKGKKVLTIAGSDSSGGAGIQADLKTIFAHGHYGMSAITAMTAQNTMGVRAIQEATPDFLAAEIDAVFEDIPPDAVKVGMVCSKEQIHVIAEKLREYGAEHIVVDPVMVATSGAELMRQEAVETLKEELLPLAEIVTPNLPELETLTGQSVGNPKEMAGAAHALQQAIGTNVLAKGGHGEAFEDGADDLLVTGSGKSGEMWLHAERVDNPNTHGTGCTLSSAIASNLARGMELSWAVECAKDYLTGALDGGDLKEKRLELGHGSGPINHGFDLHGSYFDQLQFLARPDIPDDFPFWGNIHRPHY